MNSLNVSIVIVNHNHGIKLENLINSIYKKTNSIKFEIILINNTPSDNIVTLIKNKYPKVLILKIKHKLVFHQTIILLLSNAKAKKS